MYKVFLFFLLAPFVVMADECLSTCNNQESCDKQATWIAEGEIYNVEYDWDDNRQLEVASFDFAVESWVKGEMAFGHFQHYKTYEDCINRFALPTDTHGFFRLYGSNNKGEILLLEKVEE